MSNMQAPTNQLSTSGDVRKRRKLIPKPLPATKIPKSRKEARAAGKVAKMFETVDLLIKKGPVNVLQDVTIRPNHHHLTAADVQPQTVKMVIDNFSTIHTIMPSTQDVIDTVFGEKETNDAIEAIMSSFENKDLMRENHCKPISPDIFEIDENTYELDTISFMDEKIALLQTKLEILTTEGQQLSDEETLLLGRLTEIRLKINSNKDKVFKIQNNLEKYESFRKIL